MFSSRHLFHMRDTRSKVAYPNALMLTPEMHIQLVTHDFFNPLQDVVEEEFMEGVKNLRGEECCWVCEPPIPPEREVYTTQVQLLRFFVELVKVPRIDPSAKTSYKLICICTIAGGGVAQCPRTLPDWLS